MFYGQPKKILVTFPDQLKLAYIDPVHKTVNREEVKNFSPVAVLYNVLKIFESVLMNRMLTFVHKNYILSPTQFGFRKDFSTKDSIFYLIYLLEKNKVQKKLDFSKAFDNVSHSKLISILKSLCFCGHFFKMFISFLTNRKCRFRSNN